jgi:hypothetical protein
MGARDMKFAVTLDIPNAQHAVRLEEAICDLLELYNNQNASNVTLHGLRVMTNAQWFETEYRLYGPPPKSCGGWVRRLTKVRP